MSENLPDIIRDGELSVDEVKKQVAKVQELMAHVMKKGEHYGTVPGTSSKMTLFKAGAEKLGFTFRLAPQFDVTTSDLKDGHKEFNVLCTVSHMGSDTFVAQGVGFASTMEKKYRYRKGVENPDIADTYNTVLKMAKKRAHVDAMITATAASDIFTQDVEDIPHMGLGAEDLRRFMNSLTSIGKLLAEHEKEMKPEQLAFLEALPVKAVEVWETKDELPHEYVIRVVDEITARLKKNGHVETPVETSDDTPLQSEFKNKIGKPLPELEEEKGLW